MKSSDLNRVQQDRVRPDQSASLGKEVGLMGGVGQKSLLWKW